jgi:predicted DNA-binding transcriptional regulator YafY
MGIPMNIASRPPLRRLLILDRLLRANRYPNARSAARELEVNPRTVHRDLEFLRDSWGAPLEFCHKHNGYYYRDAAFALPLQTLTEGELFALFLAERVLHDYRATPYARDLAAAFRKLTAALPEAVTIDLAHWDQVHSFRRSSADLEEAACFHQLAAAVRRGRQLELVYWTASRDDTTRRVVDPYHLLAMDGHWYLVAYCHLREEVRMFAPARVRAVKETGGVFERPADFRIADYLDTTFRVVRGHGPPCRVVLRFAPAAARYVREKLWHSSQRLQDQPDGSLLLTLVVSHLLEVKRWVLSYGFDCEVLEPPQLRSEVAGDLLRAARRYGRV